MILTNPPFGGMEEDGIESNFPTSYRTRETADLFLVLIMHLLKNGGRAAIVLPDGTLFGEGIKTRIKEQLLETCNLHTIVRLPKGVFNPYTNISTNLLFFNKGGPTTEVWYYEHPYPFGLKSYSKTKPMSFKEFVPEQEWWGTERLGFKDRVQNEFAWKLSLEELQARNYNLDCKNPHSVNIDKPDIETLIEDYRMLQNSIAAVRKQLQNALCAALEAES